MCQKINTALYSLNGTPGHTCTYYNMMTYQPGSVPCKMSAVTFFVIEPTYEGDKGGHIP